MVFDTVGISDHAMSSIWKTTQRLMIKIGSKFYLPGNVFKGQQGIRKDLLSFSQYAISSIQGNKIVQCCSLHNKIHNVMVNYVCKKLFVLMKDHNKIG